MTTDNFSRLDFKNRSIGLTKTNDVAYWHLLSVECNYQ